MAQVTRIKVTQPDGETKEPVAFLSDIKLKTVEAGNLIKVTTDTVNTKATVSVDNAKLSFEDNAVKVYKPLEFEAQTTTPTETTGLRAVSSGGETKLYWGTNVIEAHTPGEEYVKTTTFNNTIELIEDDITALDGVTAGYTTENTIKNAVDTVDAKADGTLDIIGVWTTISDKTVKKAIEDNKAAIEANTAEITALKGNHFIVVAELPATGEPNCIYLIPKDGTEERNIKEEWIYVNNDWEKIGDTAVDLTEYAKTTEVQTLVTNETTRATGVEGTLSGLTTSAKDNLVAAVNEVDAHADTAQTTANTALGIANAAVQTAEGDTYISASVDAAKLTVGVIAGTELAKILSACTITTETEEE